MESREIKKVVKETLNIVIPPEYLNTYKKYIENYLRKKEGYINRNGLLNKLMKIKKIKVLKNNKQEFTGSVIFKVEYICEYYNPEIDDVIECNIIQTDDIFIAKNDYAIIIFTSKKKNQEMNDTIKVKIVSKQMIIGEENIRIYGEEVIENNE